MRKHYIVGELGLGQHGALGIDAGEHLGGLGGLDLGGLRCDLLLGAGLLDLLGALLLHDFLFQGHGESV